MSLILEGIDLPKKGETKRIVLYGDGQTVLDEDKWGEDGAMTNETSYGIKAIQIPKGHGDIIDRNDVFTYCQWDEDALNEVMPLLKSED